MLEEVNMASKGIIGGGSIIVAILIVLTVLMEWPSWVHYISAALALIVGIMSFMGGSSAVPAAPQ